MDAVTFGEAMAMFVAQESGPLHRARTFVQATAGAETNVATGLARLGHRSGWVGHLGDDPLGLFVEEELRSCGIDLTRVDFDDSAPTGFQLKSRADGGDPEVVYFRRGSAGSRLAWSEPMGTYVSSARHLHLTGIPLAISETARDFAFQAVAAARAGGASVSFDPNLRPSLWASEQEMVAVVNEVAALADWVLPGVEEGRVLTGHGDPARIAEHYLASGVTRVVVKNGCEGAVAFGPDGTVRQPAFEVDVMDTVGAGDGFAAGLISAHLDGLEIGSALERAAAVGALATTSAGDKDGLPGRERLDRFLATGSVAA
ncbi:sugar kinase [Nocardioides sp. KC13]|uniref:Sugar kinase n=1 Tax=Nocardioides turkmenicus TaxID=2711220 RepID=A0A6M1QX02_9ACTN|nr:sugar kinase [Nocardioides sp. KC13]